MSPNRICQCTPYGHYALLALTRRRETIETYFKISQINTCSHVNACIDTKSRNNRELKIKQEVYHSLIKIDTSTPHIWDNTPLLYSFN
jgi:hypothetical protein